MEIEVKYDIGVIIFTMLFHLISYSGLCDQEAECHPWLTYLSLVY